MQPLKGVTVLGLEQAVAGPFCTRLLADLGARVIKVERPGTGDFAREYDARVRGLSSHFVWTNRSKESLTLDLKHEAAGGILEKLLAKTDVLVQNLAPGASERLGLSHGRLSDRYPQLIVCDISGYGSDGPYRGKKAYDLLIQSEAGFLSATGTEETPSKAGCSIADIAAGMHAYGAILAALLERRAGGRGCRIEISMLECMVEWMSFPLYYAFAGAPPPPRLGASHPTIYPYGPFPVSGGETIMLGVQNEREWRSFCESVLRRPELSADARFGSNEARVAHRAALAPIIADAFAPLSAAEVLSRLDEAAIANAKVNTMHDVWEHPQLRDRGRWTEIGSPAGPIPALLPPGLPGPFTPRMDPVPALGEHTEAILRELGYEAAAISALRAANAI